MSNQSGAMSDWMKVWKWSPFTRSPQRVTPAACRSGSRRRHQGHGGPTRSGLRHQRGPGKQIATRRRTSQRGIPDLHRRSARLAGGHRALRRLAELDPAHRQRRRPARPPQLRDRTQRGPANRNETRGVLTISGAALSALAAEWAVGPAAALARDREGTPISEDFVAFLEDTAQYLPVLLRTAKSHRSQLQAHAPAGSSVLTRRLVSGNTD
jgi:hypothetical protein